MITTLVFDWHGVLDFTSGKGTKESLAKVVNLPFPVVEETCKEIFNEYVLGILQPEDFWERLTEQFSLNPDGVQEVQDSLLIIQRNDSLWKLLDTLKNSYNLYVLSDAPFDKVDMIRKLDGVDIFKDMYFSCDYRMDKKSPEFFLRFLKQTGLKAEECLFIDDSPKKVKNALAVEMKTHVFENMENLKQIVSQL